MPRSGGRHRGWELRRFRVSAQPDDLDGLLAEAVAAPQWPATPSRGIAKVRYTHDGMIDLIIANPSISQNELAAHFGYSASWISQIIASDAFQARLAERRDEIVDPAIRASVEEQFRGLVFRSLDILRTKLARPAEAIPDNLVLRTVEIAAKVAGYGIREDAPSNAPGDMHVHLTVMGERLTALLHQKRTDTPIEGVFIDATSSTDSVSSSTGE